MSLLLLFRRAVTGIVSGTFAPGRRQVAARSDVRTVAGVSVSRSVVARAGREWQVRA